MPNAKRRQPNTNNQTPDSQNLATSHCSQSAQADFVAAGHSGATSVAGSPAPDLPLPQRAFALHCRGLHSDAIAAQLGVSPRTVRRWIQRLTNQLAPTSADDLRAELLRAIETQRAVLAAAWAAYDRETRLEDAILAGHHDHLRRRILRPFPASDDLPDPTSSPSDHDTASGPPSPLGREGQGVRSCDGQGVRAVLEEYDRPYRPHFGARYLAVILAAQREIARLQSLYELPLAETGHISITITRRPEGPENVPPDERPIRFPHLYPPAATSTPTNPDQTDDQDPENHPDDSR